MEKLQEGLTGAEALYSTSHRVWVAGVDSFLRLPLLQLLIGCNPDEDGKDCMTKLDKLKDRFCATPQPRDFTWDELVRLLRFFEFQLNQDGGGSHCLFVNRQDPALTIRTCRPHPKPILKEYQVREIRKFLEEKGFL